MAISKKRRYTIFFGSFIVTALLMITIFWSGDWLPGNQVKRVLLKNPTQQLQITQESKCYMDCLGINLTDVRYFIQEGEVDLPPLEREPCKKYRITYQKPEAELEYELIVRWCKEYKKTSRDGQEGTAVLEPVFLDRVSVVGKGCDCGE